MKKPNKVAVSVVVLLLLVLGTGLFVIWDKEVPEDEVVEEVWFSSSTEVRAWAEAEYDNMMSPPAGTTGVIKLTPSMKLVSDTESELRFEVSQNESTYQQHIETKRYKAEELLESFFVSEVRDEKSTKTITCYCIDWSDDAVVPLSHLRLVTFSGKEVLVPVHDSFYHMGVYLSEVPADEVKEVYLEYRYKIRRCITELNELPGMPEENRNITNLFDLVIPSAVDSDDIDHTQSRFRRLLQMENITPPVIMQSKNRFAYGKKSVREMIEMWEAQNRNRWFSCDPANHGVSFNYKPKPPKPRVTYGEKIIEWWNK
eukprot:Seg20144.1 transcript_id=Seg20144.1/GoldUCD/mRNA.D3Y31 product="hypothetical protein" protein_id=Seg20144.1/GoldUCD/D3Y31